jgi:hypothetical protein
MNQINANEILKEFEEIFRENLRKIKEVFHPERVESDLRRLDLSEAKKQEILSNCQRIYDRAIDIGKWPKVKDSFGNSSPLENIVENIKPLTSSKLYHHFRDKKINNLTKLLNHLQIDKNNKPKKLNRQTLNDFSINIAGSYLRIDSFTTELIRAKLKVNVLPLFVISFEELIDVAKNYGSLNQNIRILMIIIVLNYFALGDRIGVYNLLKSKKKLMSQLCLLRNEEFNYSEKFLKVTLGFGSIVSNLSSVKQPINIASIIKAGGIF